MHVVSVSRNFKRFVASLSLVFAAVVGPAVSASAQSIVSASFNPTTATVTATDSAGDVYTASLPPTVLRTGAGTVSATFTPPGGPAQPVTLTVAPSGPGVFSATGTLPTLLALSCSVNTVSLSASCALTTSAALDSTIARSLAASTMGEVRSQATTVIGMITDHLRAVTRDLAQGGGATSPAAPGDTVILKDFSSNPGLQYKYNGLAAGSGDARWGAWADASGSWLGNNSSVGYSGTSVVALTGLDYLADRQWLFGLSAGYTHADLSLTPSTVTHEADGALVGPYAAYVINSNMAVDALVNYTALGNSVSAPVPLPNGGYHSNRVTGASDLDFFTNYNEIKLTGYGGYAFTWEGGDASSVVGPAFGVGNNIRYGAIRLGGEAAYDIGNFEPYVPLTFEYQTTTPVDETSRAALVVGGGLRYRWSDALAGGLLVETTQIKTHTRDVLLSAHLRWSF
jgi:hypothetical protein